MSSVPRFVGEDVRPTSDKELRGWYAYALAAEVYAVTAIGAFLPVTLEQLARERGTLVANPGQPCIDPVSQSNATTSASLLARNATKDGEKQCQIHFLGTDINTASYAMYTFSTAVFIQALLLVSISAIADHGVWRKKLLLIFAYTGATAAACFVFVVPAIYFVGSLLVIVSVTCLGTSNVLNNSFLPLLVANHPSVQGVEHAEESVPLEEMNGASAAINEEELGASATPKVKQYIAADTTAQLLLSSSISAKAVTVGYSAAVSVQVLSIIVLVLFNKLAPSVAKSTIPLRLILLFVGVWWACFTIPTALWLRPRPGPPLTAPASGGRFRVALTYVLFAWRSLWKTIKIAARLKQAWRFLIAWFLLSDAIATIQGTAILFAKTELGMDTASIAVISILAMAGGITGAAVWPIIAKRMGWEPKHVIMSCVLIFEFIPLYGLLAYIPFIKTWGIGGIQKPAEIFPVAFLFGLSMGGLNSYCRSVFGVLIPPGSEAAFFALYAFTDKGSSVVGPTIVGHIVDKTGSIRPSFFFLVVVNLLPLPLIYWLDADAGRDDAFAMGKVISQRETARGEARVEDEESEDLLNRAPERADTGLDDEEPEELLDKTR